MLLDPAIHRTAPPQRIPAPGVCSAEAREPCFNPSCHRVVPEEPPLLPWPGATSSPPPPVPVPSSRTQLTSHPFREAPAALSFPSTYAFLSVPAMSDLLICLSSLSLVLVLTVYVAFLSTVKVPLV